MALSGAILRVVDALTGSKPPHNVREFAPPRRDTSLESEHACRQHIGQMSRPGSQIIHQCVPRRGINGTHDQMLSGGDVQYPWSEETPSLVTGLSAVKFGQGHGAYWHLSGLMAELKRAVASGRYECATEKVSRHDALALILENVQADLQRYALDFPQSEVAELVRQGRFLDALGGSEQPGSAKPDSPSRGDQAIQDPAAPARSSFRLSIAPSANKAEENWDEAAVVETVGLLNEGAFYLGGSYQYSLTFALSILLFVCRRAGLSFLHPAANNITEKYIRMLISRELIQCPAWMPGGQANKRELYKSWRDAHKAHMTRIQRAKYCLPPSTQPSCVYGLSDTAEAYFIDKMLEKGIESTSIQKRTAQAVAKIGLAADYPQPLRQPASVVGPDQHLVDLKAM